MAIEVWLQPTACTSRSNRALWIWVCWRGRSKIIEIDLAAGNTTDGLIPALDLFVLEDDRHYFPPYEAVPVIRQQTLQQHPEIAQALAELAGKISEDEMQRLNYAVDGQHRDAKEVVHEFLRGKKLVQ
jgi:osmoprotectant transport system substrate-binding protein